MPALHIADLDTPFLAVDVEILERNLAAAAEVAFVHGLELRPHAKTHKTAEIARRQLELGAVGLTVATVSEAEIFADAGFVNLFIGYPVWPSPTRAARIRNLAERTSLRIGVDSIESAEALGKVLSGDSVEAMIEVDCGHHRSGVDPVDAGRLAAAAARAGLTVVGVFTFPGHSYAPGAGEQAARDEAIAIVAASASLEREGIAALVRSGGSTPSLAATDASVFTESRPGVYAVNDAQQLELGTCSFDDVALTAVSTVVSKRGRDIILDAGSKVLGADRAAWATGFGRILGDPEARIVALSEHHATVRLSEEAAVPELGSVLQVIPNHACNTVNLADNLIAVRNDEVVGTWAVVARGANT